MSEAELKAAQEDIRRLKDHIFMCKTDQYAKLEAELSEARAMLEEAAELIGGLGDAEWYDHEGEETAFLKKVKALTEGGAHEA